MDPKCISDEVSNIPLTATSVRLGTKIITTEWEGLDSSPLRRALLRHLESYSGVTEPRPCDEIASIALGHVTRDDL